MPEVSVPLKNGVVRGGWQSFAHDAILLWTFFSKAGIVLTALVAIGYLAIPATRWQLNELATKVETDNRELRKDIDAFGKRLEKVEDRTATTAVWQARAEEKIDAIGEKLGAPLPAPRRKPSRPKPGSGFSALFRR